MQTKQEEPQLQVRNVCGQRKREASSMINTSKKLLNAIRHSELSGDELNGSAHRSIEATIEEEIIQIVQKVGRRALA